MVRLVTAVAIGALLSIAALAQQTVIPNYHTARDDFFWVQLYADGGETVYCALPLDPGERVTVEHAYPADWIAEAMGCDSRDCDAPGYGFAEADLHNLWPAIGRINSSRADLPFGEIPGEDRRRFTQFCPDYERTSGADAIVEPRDGVKGDLARSLLYMAIEYDLPLGDQWPMLLRWHLNDPPDDHERWRNDRIFELQRTRNGFIDGQ